jgi:MFS transporter, OFA family, oxalate/formate antiporter
MTRLAGTIKDITGSLDYAFYLSALVLIIAVVVSWVTKRPMHVASGEVR